MSDDELTTVRAENSKLRRAIEQQITFLENAEPKLQCEQARAAMRVQVKRLRRTLSVEELAL